MRVLLLSFFLFGLTSCGINDGVERGYIISHSKVESEELNNTKD